MMIESIKCSLSLQKKWLALPSLTPIHIYIHVTTCSPFICCCHSCFMEEANKTKKNYIRKLLSANKISRLKLIYIYIYIRQKVVSFRRELWLPYTPNQGRKSFHVRALNAHLLSFLLPFFLP